MAVSQHFERYIYEERCNQKFLFPFLKFASYMHVYVICFVRVYSQCTCMQGWRPEADSRIIKAEHLSKIETKYVYEISGFVRVSFVINSFMKGQTLNRVRIEYTEYKVLTMVDSFIVFIAVLILKVLVLQRLSLPEPYFPETLVGRITMTKLSASEEIRFLLM